MVPVPLLNEDDLDLLVSYSRESGEEMCGAVVNAFLAGNIDVYEEPTQLAHWINTDVLKDLRWSTTRPTYLCTHIWGHPVVITPEEIRIYVPNTHR